MTGDPTPDPSPGPLADDVADRYQQWNYPAPIVDLPAWLGSNWQWFDPSHAHRLMWPDRDYRPGMDILVAGCGTNQAAVIAYTNPEAHVVGIDVSGTSLAHQQNLADRYGLRNLELHRLPIEDAGTLGRDFDLIMSTGVLHHMKDPSQGVAALAACLRADGVMALMLYATHGRIGVQIMQSVFSDMDVCADEEGLRLIRDAIEVLPPQHPLRSYLSIAPDLGDDAGVLDTFLPGRERTYTIDECREFVASAGLVFQDVFLKSTYYPPVATSSPFLAAVARLPRAQQWSIMQRVTASNACHYFLACRQERPGATYEIDFDEGNPLRFIPFLRKGCVVEGDVVVHSGGHRHLSEFEHSLLVRVDGRRSIAEIIEDVVHGGDGAVMNRDDAAGLALQVFRALWQTDVVALGLETTGL